MDMRELLSSKTKDKEPACEHSHSHRAFRRSDMKNSHGVSQHGSGGAATVAMLGDHSGSFVSGGKKVRTCAPL